MRTLYADKNTLHKDKQKISVPNFKALDEYDTEIGREDYTDTLYLFVK